MSFDNKKYFEVNFPAVDNPLNDQKLLLRLKDYMKDKDIKTITFTYEHNGTDKLKCSLTNKDAGC